MLEVDRIFVPYFTPLKLTIRENEAVLIGYSNAVDPEEMIDMEESLLAWGADDVDIVDDPSQEVDAFDLSPDELGGSLVFEARWNNPDAFAHPKAPNRSPKPVIVFEPAPEWVWTHGSETGRG